MAFYLNGRFFVIAVNVMHIVFIGFIDFGSDGLLTGHFQILAFRGPSVAL
jgi:hypothetical protein